MAELTIGQAMRKARKRKGITGKQLAERTGYHPNIVVRWEKDQTTPMITSVIDVADALGISIDELVGHEVKNK